MGVLSMAGSASAVFTVYTSQPAWQAAIPAGQNVMLEDFEDGTVGPGVTVVATGGGSPAPPTPQVSLTGSFNGSVGFWEDRMGNSSDFTTFTFSTPTFAVGGFWDNAGPGGAGSGLNLRTDVAGVVPGIIPSTNPGTFYGFVSDTPFNSFTITSPGVETYDLDNLQWSVDVPEPTTMALLPLALVALRRRR